MKLEICHNEKNAKVFQSPSESLNQKPQLGWVFN